MLVHDTYLGLDLFHVFVDQSPRLEELAASARDLRELSFDEKLARTKELACGAMVNCYELWKDSSDPDVRARNGHIVENSLPLSVALDKRAGCCRYQGALFFVLAYEADLGQEHFLQQATVQRSLVEFDGSTKRGGFARSVFNDVVSLDGSIHHVSIFDATMTNPQHRYARKNPGVFNCAIGFVIPDQIAPAIDKTGQLLFSYHRMPSGLVIVSEEGRHVQKYPL